MINKKGKIKLLVLACTILLVILLLFLSAVSGSNTKEYNEINKVVTIKDSSGEVISDITLNTPLNYIVPRGYQKVAEFTIDNKHDSQTISSVLEELEFYDINNEMQKFDRQFDYKYKKSLGFKTVNDYEIICSDKEKMENGTTLQDCSQVITGTHEEEIFEWTDLNSLGEIPSGKTNVGIFTNVEKGDHVEWVPTFLGVEIIEWAEWSESIEADIIAYYSFNENYGIDQDDDVYAVYNSSDTHGPANTSGKLGFAYDFEQGENDYIDITFVDFIDTNYTVNLWYKAETCGTSNQRVINRNDFISLQVYNGLGWEGTMDGGDYLTCTTGEWDMITMVFDNDNSLPIIYLNAGEESFSGSWAGPSVHPNSAKLTIGNRNDHTKGTDGLIDEVGIWNRTLNTSEISDLYNGGMGITYVRNLPPTTPSLSSPTNVSYFAMNSTINFAWVNSTDPEGDTITYELEIYNESDMSSENLIYNNNSIPEGTNPTSISIKLSDYTTTDDTYYWHVRANDSEDVSGWSEIIQFQYANWTITFNLTDSVTGQQIDTSNPQDNFDISCDNGFNVVDVNNNYTANDFGNGVVECTFSNLESGVIEYVIKTQNITADSNKIIEISMSEAGGLTDEEHAWLEAVYECLIEGTGCAS